MKSLFVSYTLICLFCFSSIASALDFPPPSSHGKFNNGIKKQVVRVSKSPNIKVLKYSTKKGTVYFTLYKENTVVNMNLVLKNKKVPLDEHMTFNKSNPKSISVEYCICWNCGGWPHPDGTWEVTVGDDNNENDLDWMMQSLYLNKYNSQQQYLNKSSKQYIDNK